MQTIMMSLEEVNVCNIESSSDTLEGVYIKLNLGVKSQSSPWRCPLRPNNMKGKSVILGSTY